MRIELRKRKNHCKKVMLSWFLIKKHLILHKGRVLLTACYISVTLLATRLHAVIMCLSLSTWLRPNFCPYWENSQIGQWTLKFKIFVKSFLWKRNFREKIQRVISDVYPLSNEIPQVSLLSAIPFTIAFDAVNRIISKCNKVDHCICADDVFIFTKVNDIWS